MRTIYTDYISSWETTIISMEASFKHGPLNIISNRFLAETPLWKAEVRNPSKAITLMKQNLELRPGEQLHPWNRPHLSVSGASQDETTSPPPGQRVRLRGWADHSLPARGLPRSSANLTDLRTKKSPGVNGSSLVAHFPCAFLWWSELREFWLCCYGLNEVCFYTFFFFLVIKTKKRCGNWIWKMTSMLLYQRLCGNQNFLSLQSKSVLTIFNFWT